MKIRLKKEYNYAALIEYAIDNNYEIIDLGSGYIGENFIILKHKSKDKIYSFILSQKTFTGDIYMCIYKN